MCDPQRKPQRTSTTEADGQRGEMWGDVILVFGVWFGSVVPGVERPC
jgi:hypothetical protein